MRHIQEVVLRQGTGLGIEGASVSIFVKGTTTLATLYSANSAIPANVKANPMTTDAYGRYDFWAPNGSYDRRITYGGVTQNEVDVEIYDLDEIAANDGDMKKADNLAGLVNVATARTNLGLGVFATSTDAANLTGTVAAARIADASLSIAKTNGLQTALDAKFDKTGGTVTGNINASGTVLGSNLSGFNSGDQTITLTGDVTGTGGGSFPATISAKAVTFAKMADLPANSIVGNNTVAAASPVALTSSQVKTLLGLSPTDNVQFRDIYASRGDGTGLVALNNAVDRFIYYDGSRYNFNVAGLTVGGDIKFASATTASAANLYQSASGDTVLRSTSSRRYKTEITDLDDLRANRVFSIGSKRYKSTSRHDNPLHTFYGFIAEDVEAFDPRFVHYAFHEDQLEWYVAEPAVAEVLDEAGTVVVPARPAQMKQRPRAGEVKRADGVQYERFVVPHNHILKRHENEISVLRAGLAAERAARIAIESRLTAAGIA